MLRQEFDTLGGALLRGLVAGAAGTAAMTVSSTIEMRIRGWAPSTAPAVAAGRVMGVQPRSPQDNARFSNLVHWGYGSAWGTVRGLLGAAGCHGAVAAGLHLASVWGAEQVMLPALKVAPPAWRWEASELGIDAFHHAVYATATSLAYEILDR